MRLTCTIAGPHFRTVIPAVRESDYIWAMARADMSLLTGVSHLVLKVSDLDASVVWYGNALGLEAFRREPTRFVAMRSASGFQVGLFSGGQPNNSGALDHIAFTVSDLDALIAWADHLTAIGIAHEGIKPNPFGHSIDLFDPDGNNIELVSEA
jgi:glyoxylase I family protein